MCAVYQAGRAKQVSLECRRAGRKVRDSGRVRRAQGARRATRGSRRATYPIPDSDSAPAPAWTSAAVYLPASAAKKLGSADVPGPGRTSALFSPPPPQPPPRRYTGPGSAFNPAYQSPYSPYSPYPYSRSSPTYSSYPQSSIPTSGVPSSSTASSSYPPPNPPSPSPPRRYSDSERR